MAEFAAAKIVPEVVQEPQIEPEPEEPPEEEDKVTTYIYPSTFPPPVPQRWPKCTEGDILPTQWAGDKGWMMTKSPNKSSKPLSILSDVHVVNIPAHRKKKTKKPTQAQTQSSNQDEAKS
jgi:hypothetical protein